MARTLDPQQRLHEAEAGFRSLSDRYLGADPGFDATYQMASILRSNNEANHRRACNEVARVLRRTLIDGCLKYIDADLFILDEFQRFRNLIDPDSDAEEAEIAGSAGP